MPKHIIEVQGISKRYQLGAIGATRLRDDVERLWHRISGKAEKADDKEFWALRDVSFDVPAGEVVGIIGRNGAGKSTLLKILSRITEPTAGKVVLRGRMASLLEVGTGFHPDLTGLENIFLNGAILGMTKAEIAGKLDEIIAFSEIEKFIDTPVKRYSSGMYVRLAFAVAAHLEPEILIVDEVLAVGDQQFQNKCLGKMKDVSRGGRTVLFVSHNMMAIQSLCTLAVILKNGQMTKFGAAADCISAYLAAGGVTTQTSWSRVMPPDDRPVYFESISSQLNGAAPNQTLDIEIRVRSREAHAKAMIAIDILDQTSTVVMQALPTLDPFVAESRDGQTLKVTIQLPPLVPSSYTATFWMGSHNTSTFDEVQCAVAFEIVESPTPGRTFPHSRDHGFMVPLSSVAILS